ncbi:hypothetical protein FB451DRAFT_1362173 [Mycena latifolia]|nr:hypothetical protein FB451DRAFT_1362173 [Mycena latifolia]
MPLFSSVSGVHITGGSFYDVSGDLNVQNNALAVQDHAEPWTLQFESRGGDPQLLGADRTNRHGRSARILPYDRQPNAERRSSTSGSMNMASQYSLRHSGRTSSTPQGPSPQDPSPEEATLRSQTINDVNAASAYPWDRAPHGPHTRIRGGTFIGGNVNHIERHGESGLHILHRAIAGEAFHDAAERYPQPQCHPDTRVKMLDDLWTWSSQSGVESNVLWLHGPAGSGKSAVAQSFCHDLEKDGRLGGSFFFKRGHASRGNAKKLIPTIAYQLALLLPELKRSISERIEADPSIIDRGLSTQLQKLIVEPCQRVVLPRPVVIVVDGLDECEGDKIQQEILRSFAFALNGKPSPLRFFIASRPEPQIREIFEGVLDQFHRPLNIRQAFEDVRKYLHDEFTRIHRDHRETMATIPLPWPFRDVVDTLIEKSSGYFIYASTVIKFVDDKNFRPTERLAAVLDSTVQDSESPFAALDQLYTEILSGVPPTAQPRLLRILTVVSRFSLFVPAIEQLLELQLGDVRLALRDLQSVIRVPADDYSYLTLHHESFRDFLQNSTRSGPFCVSDLGHRTDLARCILKVFSSEGLWRRIILARLLTWDEVIDYVTSLPPSTDLVCLISPWDLLWKVVRVDIISPLVDKLVAWLQASTSISLLITPPYLSQKMNPPPEDLIRFWRDCEFMLLCDEVWSRTARATRRPSAQLPSINISPQILRILQAYHVIGTSIGITTCPIFAIHLLLELSWDELRTAICPLRTLIGEDKDSLAQLLISTFVSDLTPVRSDMARGFLCLVKRIETGEVPMDLAFYWTARQALGRHVRSCPPCPDLLRNLRDLDLALAKDVCITYLGAETFHHIVQWLKTFSEPPMELIARFEHRLKGCQDSWLDVNYFEAKWREWNDWQTRFRPGN